MQICGGAEVCIHWFDAGTKQVQDELDAFKKFLAEHPSRRLDDFQREDDSGQMSLNHALFRPTQALQAKEMSHDVAVRNHDTLMQVLERFNHCLLVLLLSGPTRKYAERPYCAHAGPHVWS
jgi:hypothetical protein